MRFTLELLGVLICAAGLGLSVRQLAQSFKRRGNRPGWVEGVLR